MHANCRVFKRAVASSAPAEEAARFGKTRCDCVQLLLTTCLCRPPVSGSAHPTVVRVCVQPYAHTRAMHGDSEARELSICYPPGGARAIIVGPNTVGHVEVGTLAGAGTARGRRACCGEVLALSGCVVDVVAARKAVEPACVCVCVCVTNARVSACATMLRQATRRVPAQRGGPGHLG